MYLLKVIPSICLMPVFMYYSLAETTTYGDVELGCPAGSFFFRNYCYKASKFKKSYDSAESECNQQNGILAPIKDKETYFFVQKLRLHGHSGNYWINLNDRLQEGKWVYGDNTPVSGFQKWAPGEPNNGYLKDQHCGYMWIIHDYDWDDGGCRNMLHFICQYPGTECRPNTFPFGQYCYELSVERKNYDDAEHKCEERGGTLANDNDPNLHKFLKNLIYSNKRWKEMNDSDVLKYLEDQRGVISLSGDWFGLTASTCLTWIFSDGDPFNPVSFPKWVENGRKKTACASLNVDWKEDSCSLQKHFICRYSVKNEEARVDQEDPSLSWTPMQEASSATTVSHSETQTTPHVKNEEARLNQEAPRQTAECTGIHLTSGMLALALMACIILGAMLVLLPFIIGKFTNRVHISIIRPYTHKVSSVLMSDCDQNIN